MGGAGGWPLWEMGWHMSPEDRGIRQGQGSQGTKTLSEATGLESGQCSLSLEAAKQPPAPHSLSPGGLVVTSPPAQRSAEGTFHAQCLVWSTAPPPHLTTSRRAPPPHGNAPGNTSPPVWGAEGRGQRKPLPPQPPTPRPAGFNDPSGSPSGGGEQGRPPRWGWWGEAGGNPRTPLGSAWGPHGRH